MGQDCWPSRPEVRTPNSPTGQVHKSDRVPFGPPSARIVTCECLPSFMKHDHGLLDSATGSLTYCNAGHLPPILIHNSGPSVPLSTGKIVLGFSSNVEYEEGTIRIERGDRLALFTDGITEATNASGNEYGDGRIESMVP